MSRSKEAKKRRNQAKNLKRRASKPQNQYYKHLATPGAEFSLLLRDGSRLEVTEYWDGQGWYFASSDSRLLTEERHLPVLLDGESDSVKAILSWQSKDRYATSLQIVSFNDDCTSGTLKEVLIVRDSDLDA